MNLPYLTERYIGRGRINRLVAHALTIPSSITSQDIQRLDKLLGKGHTLTQVAVSESISERSARQWLHRLCGKLGMRQRPQGRVMVPLRSDPILDMRKFWCPEQSEN